MNQSPLRVSDAGGRAAGPRPGRPRRPAAAAPRAGRAARPGAGRGDPALVEDHHPVADPLDLADEVRVEQHRDAARLQRQHEVADVDPAERVQRAGRLVEDDELRPGDQRDGQPEPLLHALREAADPVAGPVGQADERQARRAAPRLGHADARPAGRAGPAPRPRSATAGSGRARAGSRPGAARPRVGRPPAEQHHLAGVRAHQAEQHLDDAGLARRRSGPSRPSTSPRPTVKETSVDGRPPPVPLAQPGAPDRRRGRQARDQLAAARDRGVPPARPRPSAQATRDRRAARRRPAIRPRRSSRRRRPTPRRPSCRRARSAPWPALRPPRRSRWSPARPGRAGAAWRRPR